MLILNTTKKQKIAIIIGIMKTKQEKIDELMLLKKQKELEIKIIVDKLRQLVR